MGLAVCHQIVKSLGGTIAIASEVGQGTTATLSLPRAPSQTPQPAREPRPRILLVDDEDHILDMIARILRGNDLVYSHTGREALDTIDESPGFDLILCDVMMPDLCGVDVYKSIQSNHPGLEKRIVFITGGALSRDVDRFLRSVPNELLRKPFQPHTLREVVAAALTA